MAMIHIKGLVTKAYIGGTLVTEENKGDLVKFAFRDDALEEVGRLVRKLPYIWGGVKDLEERDRVTAILKKAMEEIEHGAHS